MVSPEVFPRQVKFRVAFFFQIKTKMFETVLKVGCHVDKPEARIVAAVMEPLSSFFQPGFFLKEINLLVHRLLKHERTSKTILSVVTNHIID